jgi:nitrate/nitrite transporter NarK
LVWWRLAADTPTQARWLAAPEATALEARIAEEQRALKPVRDYAEAFRSPFVVALSMQYFCWSIGVYGFVLWLPSMLRSGHAIGLVETGWLSAAPYLLATLLMIIASTVSDRTGRRRLFVWPFLVIGAAAFLGSYLVGRSSFWPGFAFLVVAGGAMYAPYGPFFAWIPEVLPRNVAGGAIALINSCGALGSFVGYYAVGWLNAATRGPDLSYLTMAGALLISGLLTLVVRVTVSGAARRSQAEAAGE